MSNSAPFKNYSQETTNFILYIYLCIYSWLKYQREGSIISYVYPWNVYTYINIQPSQAVQVCRSTARQSSRLSKQTGSCSQVLCLCQTFVNTLCANCVREHNGVTICCSIDVAHTHRCSTCARAQLHILQSLKRESEKERERPRERAREKEREE